MSGRGSRTRSRASASDTSASSKSPTKTAKSNAKEPQEQKSSSSEGTMTRRSGRGRPESKTESTTSTTSSPVRGRRGQKSPEKAAKEVKGKDESLSKGKGRTKSPEKPSSPAKKEVSSPPASPSKLEQIKDEFDKGSPAEVEDAIEAEEEGGEPKAAGLKHTIELGKGTIERCGQCKGCKREVCNECSACKRQEYNKCIDKFCESEETGREQRAAAKELYLRSLGFIVNREGDLTKVALEPQESKPIIKAAAKALPNTSSPPPAKRARVASEENQENEGSGKKKERKTGYVYGARSTASKVRRCGECEGCMRDDCGKCASCMDKPRFGGKGTKKRACVMRRCLTKGSMSAPSPREGRKSMGSSSPKRFTMEIGGQTVEAGTIVQDEDGVEYLVVAEGM